MPQAAAIVAGALAVASLAAVALHPARRAPRVLGWVFVIALCAMVASCLAGCATGPFLPRPPAQYRKPGMYAVRTVPTAEIAKACAGAITTGEHGNQLVGCSKGFTVTIPNPCEWPDPYAQLLCHEQGHVGGWLGTHPPS